MNSPHRHFHRLAWIAVALSVLVIALGAFTRLSNAGLSCPDWPTCYGQAAWPTEGHEIEAANARFDRAVEVDKAKLEQVHRHLAASLGTLSLLLALIAVRKRRWGITQVLAASGLVAVSIGLYIAQMPVASTVFAVAGQLLILSLVWRFDNTDLSRLSLIILFVIICQALLGMWTVIWLVKPLVVSAHLLGGLTSFSLMLLLAWWATPHSRLRHSDAAVLKKLLYVALAALAVQIALGGWTSANYAALACGLDFPRCAGSYWPDMDFSEAFILWRGIGVDYEGGVLDGSARAAIQMSHRLFAVIASAALFLLSWKLWRMVGFRRYTMILLVLLVVQISLGVGNVVLGLPIAVAMAHFLTAAALLAVIISVLARVRPLDN